MLLFFMNGLGIESGFHCRVTMEKYTIKIQKTQAQLLIHRDNDFLAPYRYNGRDETYFLWRCGERDGIELLP